MKKVSCWSRAGCCWGTKRASKFQKPVSTYLGDSVRRGIDVGPQLTGLSAFPRSPFQRRSVGTHAVLCSLQSEY